MTLRDDINHHTCAWCNIHLARDDDGVMSGGELICQDCIEELHGDDGWDRVTS